MPRALERRPILVPLAACAVLLELPTLALGHVGEVVEPRNVAGLMALMSVISFFAMLSDKRKAVRRNWRIPEAHLHLLELLGGWPGSFLAQRRYRHKVSKVSYQLTFWVIVFLWQVAAVDCLRDWQISAAAMDYLMAFVR